MVPENTAPGRGVVCAPQAEAAYEAARVLDDGGNAADALVTAAFVQGVVDPHRCGVGGFGCATLRFREGASFRSLAVDFHGRAGANAHEKIWEHAFESAAPDGFGYVVAGQVNDVGYQSITVPGMVAGVAEIHRRYGTIPWRNLVERAVGYAEEGFLVTPELAEFWVRPGLFGRVSTRDRLRLTGSGREICFKPGGETYGAGEVFRQQELAATYRRIAVEGPETFYRGNLARRIASDWAQNGALVTADDLARYRPEVHAPLSGSYRGVEIFTSPLPGGGVALLQALRLVEQSLDVSAGPRSPDYIHAMALVLQAVWRDRLENHGDPRFAPSRTAAELLSPEYLAGLASSGRRSPPEGAELGGTTQLTVIDGWGNAISFSHSLGYNSGVFSPGTGILFNNCMSAFDPRPGRTNSIAAGKARTTAVAETLLVRDGQLALVLGSPGAARITAALTQVIVNVVDHELSAAEAVAAPRFDAYGPGKLLLESRFPRPLVRLLEARGWEVLQRPQPFGVVGRVYAAQPDPHRPHQPVAGVDPGASGAAFWQQAAPTRATP